MTEHTGGHYRDTGDGPLPVTGFALRLDGPKLDAFRVYATHSLACDECKRRLWNCAEGKRLWAAYRDETD